MDTKDIVIIGGGPGGYAAALHASELGARTALIEKDELGGTCLNRGCIPTKTLIKSAEVFTTARKAGEFGIEISDIHINFPRIMERKNEIVTKLRSFSEQAIRSGKITYVKGQAKIASPNLVKIGNTEFVTTRIIIATGSEASILPVQGSDVPGVLTTDEILELKELPESLVIIGGGYIGVEFANFFNSLGTRVIILEKLPTILETMDQDISRRMVQVLTNQGIVIKTGVEIKSISCDDSQLQIHLNTPEGETIFRAKKILMAVGRKPFSRNLGLPEIGVKMNGAAIPVDDYLETNIKGIYAIGDVLGKYMLAHAASFEGKLAVENALGNPCKMDYKTIPACIFSFPELASVGLTEKEALSSQIPFKTSKFPIGGCGRAVATNETVGLVKLISDFKGEQVLGIQIMGPQAGEIIGECSLALKKGATVKDIAQTIHVHPTFSEALHESAVGLFNQTHNIKLM